MASTTMKTFEATVAKESKDTKLGIVLLQMAGTKHILIKSIRKGSLMDTQTDLVPGLQVVSINDKDLTSGTTTTCDATEAAKWLSEAETEVKIVAQGTIVEVKTNKKADAEDGGRVGISLQKSRGVVSIVSIADDGLLKDTDIRVGQRITCINGDICPNDTQEATLKLKEGKASSDSLNLVAVDCSNASSSSSSKAKKTDLTSSFAAETAEIEAAQSFEAGHHFSATCQKEKAETSVGISLGKHTETEGIVITKITETSLFKDSELAVGQKVVTINGDTCPPTTKEAIEKIKATVGELKIETVPNKKIIVAKAAAPTLAIPKPKEEEAAPLVATASTPKGDAPSPEQALPKKEEQEASAAAAVGTAAATAAVASTPKEDEGAEVIKPIVAKTLPVLKEGQVMVTVTKASADEKLGIRMKDRGGNVVISQISDDSPFNNNSDQQQQQLVAGMKVLSINGNTTSDPKLSSASSAVDFVKSLSGPVTIVAGMTVVTANKAAKDSKVGVSFGKHKNGAIVLVANDGLFAGSELTLGQKIVSINDQDCPESVQAAIEVVKDCVGPLKLVAMENMVGISGSSIMKKEEEEEEEPSSPPVGHVTVTVKKSKTEDKFGISMQSEKSDKGNVYISRLDSDGVCAGTELRVGQKVISINGKPCPKTAKAAIRMVQETSSGKDDDDKEDELTIVASNFVATVAKTDKDTKLGIVLGQMEGYIIVYKLRHDSLFRNTNIKVGQTVVLINGQSCPATVKEAVALMTSAESEVTLVTVKTIEEPKPMFPEESWVTETRTKSSDSDPFGIYLLSGSNSRQDESSSSSPPPRVVISKITPDSPFADSKLLMVGQTVISINGTKCPPTAQAAVQLIKDAGNEVTITAAPLIATVRKSTKDTKVGLTLVQSNGYVGVLSIAKQSLFSHTHLREGQKVVSINDQDFDADVTQAVKLVKEAEAGLLKVVAVDVVTRKSYKLPVKDGEGHVTATISKESKDTKAGFSVMRGNQGHIVICDIVESGLLAATELQPGQRVVSINGTPCPDTTKETMQLVREAEGEVTIVASNIVAKAEKASKYHKAGLGLGKSPDGSIVVQRLSKDCLFDLQVKQKIVSINGKPCPEGLEDTVNMLKEGEGPVSIVAVDTFERESKKMKEEPKAPEPESTDEKPEATADTSKEPPKEVEKQATADTTSDAKKEAEETPIAPAEESKEEVSEKGDATKEEDEANKEEDKADATKEEEATNKEEVKPENDES